MLEDMGVPEPMRQQIAAAIQEAGAEIGIADLERVLLQSRCFMFSGQDPLAIAHAVAAVALLLADLKKISTLTTDLTIGKAPSKARLDQMVEMMARLEPTERGTWIVREAITTWVDTEPHQLVIPAGAELYAGGAHPAAYFEQDGVLAGLWFRHQGRVFRIDESTPDPISEELPAPRTESHELGGRGLAEARRFKMAFPEHWFPPDNGGSIYDWKKWSWPDGTPAAYGAQN
jgi:hypothetical protein